VAWSKIYVFDSLFFGWHDILILLFLRDLNRGLFFFFYFFFLLFPFPFFFFFFFFFLRFSLNMFFFLIFFYLFFRVCFFENFVPTLFPFPSSFVSSLSQSSGVFGVWEFTCYPGASSIRNSFFGADALR